MKILFLYSNKKAILLADWLEHKGNEVIRWTDKIDLDWLQREEIELIVSFTYRYLISNEIISSVNGNAVNIHISYLPWNRGSNPNQWSFIDDTPKGVSIHYMTTKLDEGDIIAQKMVFFDEADTLATSYDKLSIEAIYLFKEIFKVYPFWNEMRKKVLGKGSYHTIADYKKYMEHYIDTDKENYNITIAQFKNLIAVEKGYEKSTHHKYP